MTFDQAFDRAATVAKAITVEAAPRTWLQRLRLAARDRWAPTPDERIKAIEASRLYIAGVWGMTKTLPEADRVSEAVRQRVGFGPLTWLWIAAMVVQLLTALKHLLTSEDAS